MRRLIRFANRCTSRFRYSIDPIARSSRRAPSSDGTVLRPGGVLIYRPELLRLRAELNLQRISGSDTQLESAERNCREAIELATRMHPRSIELQATTSLARILRDTGRRDEARAILADIYHWFTEGFDTADLKDAKALLDRLASEP
jgi:adenylate cyclase